MTPLHEEEVDPAELRRMSRRALLQAGVVAVGGIAGLAAFNAKAPVEEGSGIKTLFRWTHERNEALVRRLLFSKDRLAPEFPVTKAVTPRNNYHGQTPEVDPEAWRMALGERRLSMADLRRLPEVSQTSELKCVEGWSAVVHWTGCRFVDFAQEYPPPAGTRYVQMVSAPEGYPDDAYYVGLDLESCLHPQTLLAWGMNGAPLNADHGAPLRLVIPHKYGIKNIKLITEIAYRTDRPRDYWADYGYDWYAAL